MRAYLASSIGVACAAALLLPLVPATSADNAMTDTSPAPASGAAPGAASPVQKAASESRLPGRTQSLSLGALDGSRAGAEQLLSATVPGSASADSPEDRGTEPKSVKPFSLLGVVWDDARTEVHGKIQARTRPAGGGHWSGWQELEAHSDDGPDEGSAERGGEAGRGATAPLWVGDSDGVQLRVLPEGDRKSAPAKGLPDGMSLELVSPGPDPQQQRPERAEAEPAVASGPAQEGPQGEAAQEGPAGQEGQRAPEGQPAPQDEAGREQEAAQQPAELPALNKSDTEAEYGKYVRAGARSFIGPRPGIVTRKGWGADENLREKQFGYTNTVKAAFVHHTATSNNYSCSQAPSIIRSIYRYHVKSSKWRDIGYNFLVDKCGTIYEGRAGGVARPVMGAHTYGFNSDSTGIAVLGSYSKGKPSKAAVEGLAKLTAWKLGLHGRNPGGTISMTSGGGTKYKKGTKVKMHTVSGHRDGYSTDCPGSRLYSKLGTVRDISSRLQGR